MAQEVVYHSITGVPEEYNAFLPKDCPEYKRWIASQEGSSEAPAGEKKLPGGKTQKQIPQEVVIETTTRNKKKSVTSVYGLEGFGVKLNEAAKACGKKFASGASVTKNASGREQIDIQRIHGSRLWPKRRGMELGDEIFDQLKEGDVSYDLPDFLISLYRSTGLKKSHLFQIINKKKEPVYDSDN